MPCANIAHAQPRWWRGPDGEAAGPDHDCACLVAVAGHRRGCAAAFLAVIRPLMLAVVAHAVFSLVFLLGYATIGLVVTLRRPANPTGVGAVPTTVLR